MIRIIDTKFNFLGAIDNYEELTFTRKYVKTGEFYLWLNPNNIHADKLISNNIIYIDKKRAGVILFRRIYTAEDGKEVLEIRGKTLDYYLGKRLILPPANESHNTKTGNIETVMKSYVEDCLINAIQERKIEQIQLFPNQNRGNQGKYSIRYKNLLDTLTEIGEYEGIGFEVTLDLDNHKFIFDIVEGKDLTISQSINSPVIFSTEFDNIKGQEYIESLLEWQNVGYVAGQGEGAERLVKIVGEYEGLDRNEIFIDARDLENENDLVIRGQQRLKEMDKIKSFGTKVNDNSSFIFEEDWNLGDIVTLRNDNWNIQANDRVSEVIETWGSNGYTLEVIFGEPLPTIMEKMDKITGGAID